MTENEIRFTTHDLTEMEIKACENIRTQAKNFANNLAKFCANNTDAPEFTKAIDSLDQAVMWTNACIARHGARHGH